MNTLFSTGKSTNNYQKTVVCPFPILHCSPTDVLCTKNAAAHLQNQTK